MELEKGNYYILPNIIYNFGKIDNMSYGMYDENNIYAKIPRLSFKYTSDTKPEVYAELKNGVESFEGKLEWTIYFDGCPRRYHILIPKIYSLQNNPGFIDEKRLYGEQTFKETCEKAIEDIPNLAIHLEKTLTENK